MMQTAIAPVSLEGTVTLEQTARAMDALIVPGKRPNGKLAFWNACLSTRNFLKRNCSQAIIMRQYIDRPLPLNRDELHAQLGGVLGRTLNSLYEIERLWHAGIIHFNCGSTFEEQSTWRDSMCAAIPGMGMKTVSFALHIYAPYECELLTIDCWHLERLHVDCRTLRRKQYLAYEVEIRNDCWTLDTAEAAIDGGYPLIVLAACLWFRVRGRGLTKHDGLSCYV